MSDRTWKEHLYTSLRLRTVMGPGPLSQPASLYSMLAYSMVPHLGLRIFAPP